jgi:hypothetical protein
MSYRNLQKPGRATEPASRGCRVRVLRSGFGRLFDCDLERLLQIKEFSSLRPAPSQRMEQERKRSAASVARQFRCISRTTIWCGYTRARALASDGGERDGSAMVD